MNILPVKPLSVNDAWKGKRFKTDKYRRFEWEVSLKLRPRLEIPEGLMAVRLDFGQSNFLGADFDNPVKPFVDVLQKKYGFNDNRIISSLITKTRVPKGQEYCSFELVPANENEQRCEACGRNY